MGNARAESCGLSLIFSLLLCPVDLLTLQHLCFYNQPRSNHSSKFFDLGHWKSSDTHSFQHHAASLMGCMASWIAYFIISPISKNFSQGAGTGGEGLWINPNTNAVASILALGKSPSFFCFFVFSYLTFMIHRAIHPNFKAPLHLISFEEVYFTTLGKFTENCKSPSLVVMSNCGWAV